MQNIPLFCTNIISQIHIAWLTDVLKLSLRTVLETLETHQEFNEHDFDFLLWVALWGITLTLPKSFR